MRKGGCGSETLPPSHRHDPLCHRLRFPKVSEEKGVVVRVVVIHGKDGEHPTALRHLLRSIVDHAVIPHEVGPLMVDESLSV